MVTKNNTRQFHRLNPLRVVLVDDAQIILDRLSAALGGIATVQIVGTSQDSNHAISQIQRLTPDLIVLDIRLRDSNGWDVLQFVSNSQPQIRVFVFSNDSSDESRARFVAGGADEFFDKSFDFHALHSAVQNLSGEPNGL